LARARNARLARTINWSPEPLEIEALKGEIAGSFRAAFSRVYGAAHVSVG
jgi:hypothetical protein